MKQQESHTQPPLHTRMIGIICPDNHGRAKESTIYRKKARGCYIAEFYSIRITCKQAYLISLVDG